MNLHEELIRLTRLVRDMNDEIVRELRKARDIPTGPPWDQGTLDRVLAEMRTALKATTLAAMALGIPGTPRDEG